MTRCFYFGAWSRDKLGHYLYDRDGSNWSRLGDVLPFRPSILDTGLLPQQGHQVEGRVCRSVINGWTVVAFWDRSGDSRPGSNSSFVVEGEHTAAAALAVAREQFPTIFARFAFPLDLARAGG